MKNIKTNIFLFAMLAAAPMTVNAQTADDADSTVVKKKVHVAFRDVDADHLLGGLWLKTISIIAKNEMPPKSDKTAK